MSITKVDYLGIGKNIVETNPFYNTLNLFLKYYFVNNLEKEFYLNSFIKDIIKDENEFKVFIIFKEYALHIYHKKYEELFDNLNSLDNKIYILIGYVKLSYENDRNVIKPYISSLTDNQTDIINKFNYIKSSYIFKEESNDKFEKLKDAITYLEKARYHEEQAKYYNNIALENLKNIKCYFENTFSQIKYNDDSTKVLSLKL
jgi:hypothetical protein